MPISRRQFLGGAALGIALPGVERLLPLGAPASARCLVLDLGAGCTLRESLNGYRKAMPAIRLRVPMLIVPAALSLPMVEIDGCLRAGGTVLFETGVAFAHASSYARHADSVLDALGVRIRTPVDLWPRRTPYVDLTWPTAIKVRDFSRVAPVAAPDGETIAEADGRVVGVRRSVWGGTLVFLGTPLGPALMAGDADARRWLSAVVQS